MPANVQPVSASADVIISDNLSPEEKLAVEQRMASLGKLLATEPKAKYKLEVFFDEERSAIKPFGGIVTWWESGTKLHGGGDVKLYCCDSCNPDMAGRGCGAFLHEKSNGFGFLVCSKCGTLWKDCDVVGEIYYRLPVQHWATVLLRWFRRLDFDADIRLKYARDDIRSATAKEQERQMHGDLLNLIRDQDRRSTSIYTLSRIVKDTGAGADLFGRITAFLKA